MLPSYTDTVILLSVYEGTLHGSVDRLYYSDLCFGVVSLLLIYNCVYFCWCLLKEQIKSAFSLICHTLDQSFQQKSKNERAEKEETGGFGHLKHKSYCNAFVNENNYFFIIFIISKEIFTRSGSKSPNIIVRFYLNQHTK